GHGTQRSSHRGTGVGLRGRIAGGTDGSAGAAGAAPAAGGSRRDCAGCGRRSVRGMRFPGEEVPKPARSPGATVAPELRAGASCVTSTGVGGGVGTGGGRGRKAG